MSSQRKIVKDAPRLYEFRKKQELGISSGEVVQVSGVYELDHRNHTQGKQYFVAKGVTLPLCPVCGKNAIFRLVEKVEHISEDPDFADGSPD